MFEAIRELLMQGDLAVSQHAYKVADMLYREALEKSYSFRDDVGYYHALGRVADVCLLQGNHENAARLYEDAFFKASANKDHDYAAKLNAKYKFTTKNFVELKRRYPKSYRAQLDLMRKNVAEVLMVDPVSTNRVEWTKDLFNKTAETISEILGGEFHGAIKKFGLPKTKYCVMGLGSFGRREMSTHSDIEWTIIIENDSPENIEYFIHISQFLNMRMMKLGETDINDRHDSFLQKELADHKGPSVKGIAMDQGFKTPPGKPGDYVLIGTPEKLAILVDGKAFATKSHLIAAMISSGYLFGDENLYAQFKDSCRKQMLASAVSSRALALKFMQEDLKAFKNAKVAYELFFSQDKQGELDCKAHIYRPFNRFIETLSLLKFGIEDSDLDSFSRIDKLAVANFFSKETAERLKTDFAIIAQLRMRLYLYHGQQEEGLRLASSDSDFPITNDLAEEIRMVTKDLELIFIKLQQYVDTKDSKCFYHLFEDYKPQLAVTTTIGSISPSVTRKHQSQFFRVKGEVTRSNSCSNLQDYIVRIPSPAPSA